MSYDNFNTWGYGDNVSNSLIVTNDGINKEEVEKTVSDAIDNLIDGAPEALDTLKELADALDNDASAVTTITNNISNIDNRLKEIENKESDYDDTELREKINSLENEQENFLTKKDAEETYQPIGNYLTEHQSLDDYAKTTDVNEQIRTIETKIDEIEIPSMDNVVKTIDIPTEELPERKAIALEMGDMLLGGGNNLVMLNRWGVVDLGTSKSPINLNTPKDVRPTVQEAGIDGENAHQIAYTSDFKDYALKSELPNSYDDTEIKNRLNVLETKEDKDTIYDDTELRARIETIEKIDHDTFLTKEEASHDYLKNGSLDEYALKSEIPTIPSKVSEFENDSKYQTKDEVDERITNIIGAAPEALDTLGEIAEALKDNNDAVTAITTSLSEKVDKVELATLLDEKANVSDIENLVKFDEFGVGRKTIQLKNNDTISGIDTNNKGHNLVMLSKWDVADFGAKDIHFNITSSDRPTVQVGEQTGEEAYHIAYKEDIPSLDDYATEQWVENKKYLTEHQDISNLVTKNELEELTKDNVNYVNIPTTTSDGQEYPERKAIVLNNHDTILGTMKDGGTNNLVMMNAWDVADFGTSKAHTNINTNDYVSINDKQVIAAFDKELNKDKEETGRKILNLNNTDIIVAKANNDRSDEAIIPITGSVTLMQLNKWNVVDLGSPKTITNINTPDGERPTVQEKSQTGAEAHKIAYLDDIEKEINELKNKFSSIIKCYKPIEGDDLINIIKEGGDITLMNNVQSSSDIILTKSSNIDLNNHEVNAYGSKYGDNITIGKGTIIIKNGVINPSETASSEKESATIMAGTKYPINVTLDNVEVIGHPYVVYMNNSSGNAELTINSGRFYTNIPVVEGDINTESPCVYVQKIGNKVNIKGGTFGLAGNTNRYILNIKDDLVTENVDPRDFIEVTGGSFYNFDPSNCISEGEGTNFVANGYKVISEQESNDTIYTVVPE